MNRNNTIETSIHNGFNNGLDHLFAELKRIELILLAGAKRTGLDNNQTSSDSYNRIHSLTTDTESIFSVVFDRSTNNSNIDVVNQSLRKLESDIIQKKQESQDAGIFLPLCELQRLFNLSAFDIDIVLMCLLPEIDPRFERYYAYLNDDITKKSLTVNMITRLLCVHLEDKLEAKKAFNQDAHLISNNLIHMYNNPVHNSPTLGSKFVQIDERIADYLIERNRIDHRLRSFTNLYQPTAKLPDLIIPQYLRERLFKFISHNKETNPAYHFQGQHGVGKRTTAEAICNESRIPLLYIDIKRMLADDISRDHAIRLIFREGLLQSAAIYLDRSDLLINNEYVDANNSGCDALLSELENYPHQCFLSSENNLELLRYPRNKLLVTIDFSLPDYAARKQLWERQCQDNISIADDVDFDDLANKFRLNAVQIADALSSARSVALWRDPENGVITSNDLYLVCREQSRQRLNTLT
ncbi:MAG TPA: hypothetical protein G4O15_02785, partial [Dehalococcoidia bacterium]|nr:hypothetical protein [Dehalococcoidia bacterium]